MLFALLVVLGYLLGSCPWGYWLVRVLRHEDIRTRGSGNIGATNVARVYGRPLGLTVFALDFLKGFAPTFLAVVLVSHLCGIAVGAATMLGHIRPLFLKFEKGGKAIATGGGVFFALAPPVSGIGIALWVALYVLFGIASVASLAVALWIPVGAWLFGYPRSVQLFGVVAFLGVAALHRGNMKNLWHGTERQSSIALVRRLRPLRS